MKDCEHDSLSPILARRKKKKLGSRIGLDRDRPSPHIKIVSDLQSPASDALEFLSAELRHDRSPLADRSGADTQRPRDIRGSLKVIKNVLFEHEPSLTTVQWRMQPQSKSAVLTLVDMDKLPELKDRLADAMREAKVNQSDLASACGVSAAAVHKWITGASRKLTAENYASAGRALGVREEWLRTGKLPRERQNAKEERQVDEVMEILLSMREPVASLAAAMARLAALPPAGKRARGP